MDRARAFHTERAGFRLDADSGPNAGYRVVQVSPPGSACAVQFGVGLTDAPPGRELSARGVPVTAITHKPSIDGWQGDWAPGIDPRHRDYASVAGFADPDGNTWMIQEIGHG